MQSFDCLYRITQKCIESYPHLLSVKCGIVLLEVTSIQTYLKVTLLQNERTVMSQHVKLVRDGGSIAKATFCSGKSRAEKSQEKTDKIIRKGDAVSTSD